MIRTATLMALAFAAIAVIASAQPAPGWTLVWSDEFGGPAGSKPSAKNWTHDIGRNGGWGNNELQEYTNSTDNAAHDGQGQLVITARYNPKDVYEYSSARLVTRGLRSWTYGRFEARLQVPRGQGLWPAFWMLGDRKLGWPDDGEIDIMEHLGREPKTLYGTLHGPGYSGARGLGGNVRLETDLAAGFHVFAVEWAPGEVRWLLDEREYHRVRQSDLPAGTKWVFDHDFHLLLNLAVGGNWPGNPDSSTRFPQSLRVDYVRVYQRKP